MATSGGAVRGQQAMTCQEAGGQVGQELSGEPHHRHRPAPVTAENHRAGCPADSSTVGDRSTVCRVGPCPFRYGPLPRIGGATSSGCSVGVVKILLGAGVSSSSTAARESAASESSTDNRDALRREITHAAVPPGLLADIENQPVGWTRVWPRFDFPRVSGNRALAKVLTDDPGVWWVTCFAVHSRHRRSGVGSVLPEAAVTFARDHGATAVEGHPVDVAALRAARLSGSALYTGPWRCSSPPASPRLRARSPLGR